ncbi:uncharacterized protein BDZ99DRAFT_308486 [Mytilinidion resinicola]|uniref:Uncharacterized protein n=1 Tax=Mytilinidion resinicola TaxID=574789 RepID=A0A6A6YNF0_9PEZI|nr:uncharacterized protein BDZ99DRAFT_308486 [Mytilinidion resinicola]KAF2810271.1 hypothetical protein BDZ99DRAFT_308486 [Mytilinidion resinicola]
MKSPSTVSNIKDNGKTVALQIGKHTKPHTNNVPFQHLQANPQRHPHRLPPKPSATPTTSQLSNTTPTRSKDRAHLAAGVETIRTISYAYDSNSCGLPVLSRGLTGSAQFGGCSKTGNYFLLY